MGCYCNELWGGGHYVANAICILSLTGSFVNDKGHKPKFHISKPQDTQIAA